MQAIEKEVVACQKSVLAGKPGELEAEVEYLMRKYPRIKFYQSKDNFKPEPYGIRIWVNSGQPKVSCDVHSLIESGIYGRLTKEKFERLNFRRERVGVYKPPENKTTMDGCISTLFILCVSVAALAYCYRIQQKFRGMDVHLYKKMQVFQTKRTEVKRSD